MLRIDTLCSIVPALRGQLDALRFALESNSKNLLEPLLTDLQTKKANKNKALEFFQNTRMMQPVIEDGWFRLLGGHYSLGKSEERLTIWLAEWEMKSRSIDFFRLFLEALISNASGYTHPLRGTCRLIESTLQIFYLFEVESIRGGVAGVEKTSFNPDSELSVFVFSKNELPTCFFKEEDADNYAKTWLLWVCMLTTANLVQKPVLYENALQWINSVPVVIQAKLLNLYWRERLSDAGLWEKLDDERRRIWWDKIRLAAKPIPRIQKLDQKLLHYFILKWSPIKSSAIDPQHFFNIPLRNEDFADAWTLMGMFKSSELDPRRAKYWWRTITPKVLPDRLKPNHSIELGRLCLARPSTRIP